MIIILLIFSLGSLAISIVLPKNAIELQSGTILALVSFLDAFGFKSMVPLIAFMVACGSIGQISTWTVGPSKGLMTTARHGELPPFLQKMNRKSMPVSILWLQALIVALISSVFLFMPSVSASYQLLFYLTAQLYLIMYILMFLAGIVLRYKYPKVKRSFKIPFGNMGMNIIGIIGVLGCVFAIICGFLPPEGLGELHIVFFEIFLILGIAIFSIIPIIIHNNRKDSWHLHKKE